MSKNNQINSKSWATASVTEDTISDVWDYIEEAFTGFEGVTFERDTENVVMYVYLDEDKKIYMTVKVNASTGVLIEYYLNGVKCTYKSSVTTSSSSCAFSYLRTKYGIAWYLGSSAASYANFKCFYTQKSTPTMIVGDWATNATSYYILSTLHDTIEGIREGSDWLTYYLGDHRFIMTNAYSCLANLKLRHLYRVLGVPSSSYAKGAIRVGGRNYFWFTQFALEFEEEE